MNNLELFYTYHDFTDDNARDDWYLALSSDDKLALLEIRQMLESDPLIVAMCERGGVVTSIEATITEVVA